MERRPLAARPTAGRVGDLAFVDFTRDNGAASSGSHRWPDRGLPALEQMQQPVTPQQLAYAEPAGSAVVYLGGTMHAGAPTSPTCRAGVRT